MAWPTDDLTKVHLDSSGDDPSQARAELLALVNKVQAMLAEIASGATVWHSGNDGAGSGLDADLLDGQSSAFYRDASNLNAGTIPGARIAQGSGSGLHADLLDGQHGAYYLNLANLTGLLSTGQYNDASVTQAKIAAAAVGQAQLKTAAGEVSRSAMALGTSTYVLPGGAYGFYPRVKGEISFVHGTHSMGFSIRAYSGFTPAGYVSTISIQTNDEHAYAYADQRYIQSSPPYKIGTQDFGHFIYALINADGKIISTSTAQDPTWWILNPPPHGTDEKGISWRMEHNIPAAIRALRKTDPEAYILERKKIQPEKRIITRTAKNKFMNDLPHPFLSKEPTDRVVLLCPSESKYNLLCDLCEHGESIAELLHAGKIEITDPTDALAPAGVFMHKFKFKKQG